MNQSNYALLTALYDSQSSDLYKDIYFPIIKYGIFLLYQKQIDATKYYDTTNIQEVIVEKFGVKIPLIVLSQTSLLNPFLSGEKKERTTTAIILYKGTLPIIIKGAMVAFP